MIRPTSTPPIQVGMQSIDGLTRPLSLTVGGRTNRYNYTVGQTPASSLTLADGKSIAYEYLHELENEIKSSKPEGEPAVDSTYNPALGLLHTRENALGKQTRVYNANGHLQSEVWRVDGKDHSTDWHYSLQGTLLGHEDCNKVEHTRDLDPFGRPWQIKAGQTTCVIEYDDLSRPCRFTTTDRVANSELVESLTYDGLGREFTRTFTTTLDGATKNSVQTLTYTDIDQVKTRQWQEADITYEEGYDYDALGRLAKYKASPGLSRDSFGNCVIEQSYTLNVLDGYEKVHTSFSDGTSDLATYHYDNADDPCQVSAIEHTHPSWPARITLCYDLRGRLVSDSLGRTVIWDGHDRVTRVEYQGKACTYGYDPNGNLCDRWVDTQLTRSFISDGLITHEQRGDDTLQFMGEAARVFAISRLTQGIHQNTLLLGYDAQGSVRLEVDQDVGSRHYTAHGAEDLAHFSANNPFGFAGERREPLTGWYIPGSYRPYDPLLMIFLAPDNASPFGSGGPNAYAYCSGDPVNRIDPSGHSAWKWVKIALGIAGAAIGIVATFGALSPIIAGGVAALTVSSVLSLTSATLSVVSAVTGSVAAVIELTDPDSKAAEILGDISFATGLLAASTSSLRDIAVKRGAQSFFNRPLFSRAGSVRPSVSPTPSININDSGRLSPSLSQGSNRPGLPTATRADGAVALNRTNSSVQPSPSGIEMTPIRNAESPTAVTDISPKTSSLSRSSGSAADISLDTGEGAINQLNRSPYQSQIPPPPGSPTVQGQRLLGHSRGPTAQRRLFTYRETTV